MAKVDGSISSVIQGVSQQPARDRLPGQCELQVNCSSDVVNGLTRRGPSEYLLALISTMTDEWTFADYDADSLGSFVIAYKAGEIKLFDLDGVEYTVVVDGSSDTYIPSTGLEFIGIDADIYFVDTAKTVLTLPDTRTYVQGESLVFLLGGQYGRDYKIDFKWVDSSDVEYNKTVMHTTADGSVSTDIEIISTNYITEELVDAMVDKSADSIIYEVEDTLSSITLTNNPGWATGTAINYLFFGGKTYTSLNEATTYYVIDNGLDNGKQRIQLASSPANATAGTALALLSTGGYRLGLGGFSESTTTGLINDRLEYTLKDDVIHIAPKTGEDVLDLVITVSDGAGSINIFAVNNKVSDVGDLPAFAPNNYIVQVEESGSSTVDDWYLEFISDETDLSVGAGFGTTGTWVETVAPDLEYKLDPATMPHLLEKTDTTEFTLKQGDWDDRAVGDDDTNPFPSFVDNVITDINSFQGRLAVTSDINLILSRTNKFNNFFKQSATTLAPDDVIDVASALGTYSLKKMVEHNRDLVIFSDKAQFIMFGRNSITPENSSLVKTTDFEADLGAAPVGAGKNVFFSFDYGNNSGVQEFFTEGTEDSNDATPITQHVLKYIKGRVTQLVSTTNFNTLVVRSDDDPKTVYVYEYVWYNRKKAQSSWSTWTFNDDVKHMFFTDNLLYIVTYNGSAYELLKLNIDDNDDTGVNYRVMLDQKATHASVNTTFDPSYTIDDITNYIAVQGANCPNPGLRAEILSYASGTVTLKDDMSGGDVLFGRKYLSRFIPTSPFVRDREGNKVGSSRLVLKHYVVHFDDTGYFNAQVTDNYGYSSDKAFNGRVLGSPSNLIGSTAISSGSFLVPYKKDVDKSSLEINNDTHLPMYITELEWIGQLRKKGKRITGG